MQLNLHAADPHRDTVRNLTTPFSCLGRSAEDRPLAADVGEQRLV